MNNRSQVVSPSPAESRASSETSETQSVSDEASNYSGALRPIRPQAKRASGQNSSVEKEKPPWKSVSIATPSKADRNAMLRAKILDATRRAMLLQRIANASTQTDPVKTLLMRDAHLDAQPDLIGKRSASVETDGAVTITNNNLKGFILTQTVGQMTDAIRSRNLSTQTARPQTSWASATLPKSYNLKTSNKESSLNDLDHRILKNEEKMHQQLIELEAINEKLRKSQSDEEIKQKPSIYLPTSVDFDENLTSQINLLSEPTLSSWDNNDLLWDNYTECLQFPSNLSDNPRDSISKRLFNMRLRPLTRRPRNSINSQQHSPSASCSHRNLQRQLYDELIYETTALLNIVEKIPAWIGAQRNSESQRCKTDCKISSIRPVSPLPPSISYSAMQNEWQQLETNLKQFENKSKNN